MHLFPKGFPNRTVSLSVILRHLSRVRCDRNVMMSVFVWLQITDMIFNWKSAAYIRKQLPQKERDWKKICHLKVHFSLISSRLYRLTTSSLSLYLTCSSCFVILSLTFILLSFMCLCSVFKCSSYSTASGLSVRIEEISFFSASVHYLFFCFGRVILSGAKV